MSQEKKDSFEQLLRDHLSTSLSRPSVESCPDENWMAAYLEGSLSRPFKDTFERHLLQCGRCEAELASLLRTGATEAPASAPLPLESKPRGNPVAFLFDWTRAAALRPIFAILLVSVVTGVVGYRLLRNERILEQGSIEISSSGQGSSSPVADEDASPAPQSGEDRKSLEETLSYKSKSAPVRREADQSQVNGEHASQVQRGDVRSPDRESSQDNEKKDAFAVEPPATVPAESNRDSGSGLKRRDTAEDLPAPPELLQKEALSDSVEGQNSRHRRNVDETSAKPKNQANPAAPAAAPPVLGASADEKVERDKLAEARQTRAGVNKKQVPAGGPAQTGASASSETMTVSRIDAGGKRFDLRDGSWRDASILPDDPWPTLVNMNSADFERHRKQLAPYQAVIARPEDVLIKLHNRVYRIQKAPK